VKREIRGREIRERWSENSLLFGWIEIEKRMSKKMDKEKFMKMIKDNFNLYI
jgi:hypothetical protein